jgi:signal transduction histidine kinase
MFLSTFEAQLRLGIEDNGVGFDAERLLHRRDGPDGCGLGMMQRWAEISGGRCSIEASPRRGAQVLAFWQKERAVSATREAPQDSEMGVPPSPAPA